MTSKKNFSSSSECLEFTSVMPLSPHRFKFKLIFLSKKNLILYQIEILPGNWLLFKKAAFSVISVAHKYLHLNSASKHDTFHWWFQFTFTDQNSYKESALKLMLCNWFLSPFSCTFVTFTHFSTFCFQPFFFSLKAQTSNFHCSYCWNTG